MRILRILRRVCILCIMSTAQTLPPAMRAHEIRFGRPLREVFLDGHYDGMSREAIAADLGVSLRTLENWMARLGLGWQRVLVDLHEPEPVTGSTADGTSKDHEAPDLTPSGSSRVDGVRAGAR